jgi:hypothetical protein
MMVVLVTAVGEASGAKAAAAVLACVASEPDRAALLIDLDDCPGPRSSLVATAGARALEERLVAHLPDAAVASRGRLCQLTLPAGPAGVELLPAALPLARESTAVIHLPPSLLRPVLDSRIEATAALLRADLGTDRALTALAACDLMAKNLRVVVLKRPLGWLAARAAFLGAAPANALPVGLTARLLSTEDKKLPNCYDRGNGAKDGQREALEHRRHPE